MPAPPRPARATWPITLVFMLDVRLTANARALASRQAGALQAHRHLLYGYLMSANPTGGGLFGLNTGSGSGTSSTYIGDTGGQETRPVNTAYCPRIHA